MAEKIDPRVNLRICLEDRNPEGNPDDFARLITAALEAPGDPYVVLCNATWGHYTGGEMSFFEDWASGRVAPAPLMRAKIVRAIRANFRDGELVPQGAG